MIIRSLTAGVLLLGLVSFSSAQTTKPAQPAKPVQAAKRVSLSEAEWPAFFKTFREAVGRKDKEALKEMMVRDFFFSGGSDENQDGDTRDEAFKFLDDPEVRGWKAFVETLAKGAVPSPPNPNEGGKKYPSRVSPPAARKIRSLENAPPWIASFEFRNGKWYCTSFSECCD